MARQNHKYAGQTRSCEFCEAEFEFVNKRQKFCSRKCYRGHHSAKSNKGNNAARREAGKYTWRHMRDRCNNPSHESYPKYGAQGITVDFKDFADFQKTYLRTDNCEKCGTILNDENRMAMDGRQFDRINPTGPYSVNNAAIICRSCHMFSDGTGRWGHLKGA